MNKETTKNPQNVHKTKNKQEDLFSSKKLVVSPSPHIKDNKSIERTMKLVVLALLFPTIGGIYFFGGYILLALSVAIITAILTEYAAKKLRKREFIMDWSCVVTALLLVLVLPPRIPLWIVAIGAAFSIAIAKEAFGGLGHNIFNPALGGRAFLAVCFTGLMTKWIAPIKSLGGDTVTTATPLGESFGREGSKMELYKSLFFGDVGGCVGEISVLLILGGAVILLIFGVIKLRIPVVYIGVVFLLTWLIPGEDPVFHILAGGLMLGAFFMATDYVTAPLTAKGQVIFAAGAGVLTVLIRLYGGMAEGVCFSILFMNAFVPLIDRYVRIVPYGFVEEGKKGKGEGK